MTDSSTKISITQPILPHASCDKVNNTLYKNSWNKASTGKSDNLLNNLISFEIVECIIRNNICVLTYFS